MFKGKTLLITGGTGSFGNAVLKRFLHTDIAEIRIFSRDEKKQDDMRKLLKSDKVKFYIGDVRNLESIREAVKGVDYIFHAAALKQVPSCEFFPMEAVRTNVIGTDNVLTAAIDAGVKKVVCLSTDKAAYPINAMGTSKAMMEKVIVAKSRNVNAADTTISCTRYGNVMASRGSVIPLFIDQIRSGQPITLTNPDMTRFLMNLDEAVDLVLFAFQNAKQGDLFVQKSPASTIGDLAQALKELFQTDTEVKTIGTRHGEKNHETLLTREEKAKCEDLGTYFRVPADTRDLNYDKYFSKGNHEVEEAVEYNSENTERLDVAATKQKLLTVDFVNEQLAAAGIKADTPITLKKTVLVTGASGFIGRNMCARLAQDSTITVLQHHRDDSLRSLQDQIAQADFIFHFAAVMRPKNEADLHKVNVGLTKSILECIEKSGKKTPVLLTSSIQAELDNPYGRSKKAAEELVLAWSKKTGIPVYVYRLPNVFGRWAQPNSTSVVATFSHNIARGLAVSVDQPDRELALAHIDDVVDSFMDVLQDSRQKPTHTFYEIGQTFKITVQQLADKIRAFKQPDKLKDATIDFKSPLDYSLHKTYLSYAPDNT